MNSDVEVAIVGAGPYGLSVAAHLLSRGVSLRIFGVPMQTWREHMPRGMLLKSDGFASDLSDPEGIFKLRDFCAQQGIDYHNTRIPVQLETFTNYGMAFQKRLVSDLEERQVVAIDFASGNFKLRLDDGERFTAQSVILAVGITHFDYLPPSLANLPADACSHSSTVKYPDSFRGRNVTVIGGGASAIDIAALLHESGADVNVIARAPSIRFHDPPAEKTTWFQELRRPPSGLGPGWRSRLCVDGTNFFHLLPLHLRARILKRHLGPSAGWPMKKRVLGRIPLTCGTTVEKAEVADRSVRLTLASIDGSKKNLLTEHVIAATGYRVDLNRLTFLSDAVRARIRVEEQSPVLSNDFESTVPKLYFVGVSSALHFGPMMRFAYGSDFAAHSISKHLPDGLPRRQLVHSAV